MISLRISLLVLCFSFSFLQGFSQSGKVEDAVFNSLGVSSIPEPAPISLSLFARYQHRVSTTKNPMDKYDRSINSPKSVNYLPSKKKFYVQSLEGYETVVYSIETFEKLGVIRHVFNAQNQDLFKDGEYTVFDYKYRYRKSDFNIFSGKPVESCFSHNGKYLWVTYYRRSYDANAESPSAVAIIDTDTDEIVRVMPTGILPKMIAASPDSRYVAVTHWGDNTLGIIDTSSDDPFEFKYVKHAIVDKRLEVKFEPGVKVDRDNNCGYCLRGTVFTPDSKYLLVGRMGGDGGIAVFDMEDDYKYLGVNYSPYYNIRHLIISGDNLIISSNSLGYVQSTDWNQFIQSKVEQDGNRKVEKDEWRSCYVGPGARTIVASADGRYVFACVNDDSKIVVLDTSTMRKVAEIAADSFPVGMEITDDDQYLMVTAQGKSGKGGGHSVMIYKVTIN
ncbi:MAG: hypothetical protein KF687_09830 [Cyclobacteriaceae bacterium]|nr:hypothetical protein [Cyclobacteriaceae bacterium]